MDKDYHIEALKGTRDAALEAIPKISDYIERCGNNGHRKHQMICAYNIFKSMFRNWDALRKAAHYDIYIDIFLKVLAPKMEPTLSLTCWRNLLIMLNCFFQSLIAHDRYSEANEMYSYFLKNHLTWLDSDDFRHLLSMHGSQLQALIKRLQQEPKFTAAIKDRVNETLSALETLFVKLTEGCDENPIDCTDLMSLFIDKIITKQLSIQIHLSTTLYCDQMQQMYNAHINLLRANLKFKSTKDHLTRLQTQMHALFTLLHMDVYSGLKQQVAIQYALVVRKMTFYEGDKTIHYCISLLCNMLKIAYVRHVDGQFKKDYSELCSNFCNLFKQSGEMLMQQLWFQDTLIFIYYLFFSMHWTSKKIFDVFWQQMDNTLYISHIKFLTELVKITPHLTKMNLTSFSCCTNPNFWFHILLNYSHWGLESYIEILEQYKDESKEDYNKLLSCVQTKISTILQQSIDTLISMDGKCAKSRVAISKMCYTFAKLLQTSNRCIHIPDQFSLATDMTRLKSLTSAEEWIMIMSRVYKNVVKCKDPRTACDVLSCYIAELVRSSSRSDLNLFHSFIRQHHYNFPGICLFEVYTKSSSPFKPELQKSQKRFYLWLELQNLYSLSDKAKVCEVYTTLAKYSQTKYDFINVVHVGKLIEQPQMFSQVIKIYDTLRFNRKTNEKRGTNSLTRLETLTLAHATSLIVLNRLEIQKTTMVYKDFQETNIQQLMQEKSLLSLSVTKEMDLLEMAKEAFQGFEEFFNKADAEPIPLNEGIYLDWTSILEDLVSLARYFQLSGYFDHALDAWLLQYRIANFLNDTLSSIQSLTFFCEYHYLIEKDKRLELSKEVVDKTKDIKCIMYKLPQLLKRQQHSVLICLCQIAYYYASQKRFSESQKLLNLVKELNKNILNCQDVYNIVMFTFEVVSFRILWKYVAPARSECWPRDDYSLLHEIDVIIDHLRIYTNISTADKGKYMVLLMNSIDDFTEFAAIRLCDNFLSGFLSSAVKLCVEGGLALRTAQVLSKWMLINMQMEYLQKAEIKRQLVECILDLRDYKQLEFSFKRIQMCAMTTSKELQNIDNNDICSGVFDEVRKVAALGTLSPINSENCCPSSFSWDHKLENCDNSKNITKKQKLSQIVLWSRFHLSCLTARLNFLSSEFKDLPIFYENCEKWLDRRKDTIHFQMYQSEVLFCMIQYANFLRASKQYENAQQKLEMYVKHSIDLKGKVDEVYSVNLKLQLQDTKREQVENKTRYLPIKNAPPKLHPNLREPKETPNVKPTKYKTVSVMSCKKPMTSNSLKSTPFAIYSDRKSPKKLPIKHTKFLAGAKHLNFGEGNSESGCSSGSESSAESSKNKKNDLDMCQVIDISDLSDSDDDVAIKSNTVVKVSKSKSKLPQQQPLKFKFFDSVELEDFTSTAVSKMTTERVIKSRTLKKSEISKDELPVLVNRLQNLDIVSISFTSKTDSPLPERRRSPRSTKAQAEGAKIQTEHKTSVIKIDYSKDSSMTNQLEPEPVPTTTGRIRRRARVEKVPSTSLSLRSRQRN